MTLKECYQLLQVADGASLEEVKSAYRHRAFQLHPDLHPNQPNASRQFQLLNEAYVQLTRTLEADPRRNAKTAGRAADKANEETVAGAKRDYDQAKNRFSWARGEKAAPSGQASQKRQSQQARPEARRAGASYQAQQDEVLQDILSDPFARRVFEDIYREIRKGGPQRNASGKAGVSPPPAPPEKKLSLGLGRRSVSVDMTHGVTGAIRNWARRQIDEEQVVYLPAETLLPGSRVRLSIRRGLNDEKKTIEFTLPMDFVVGRPVRLKGLGKKLGPWKGDLYIKLFAKI